MQTNVAVSASVSSQTPAPPRTIVPIASTQSSTFYPLIMIQPEVARRLGDVKAALVLQVIHEQLVIDGIKDSNGTAWTTMNSEATLSGCNVQQIIDKLVGDGYLIAKNTDNTVMYTIDYDKI